MESPLLLSTVGIILTLSGLETVCDWCNDKILVTGYTLHARTLHVQYPHLLTASPPGTRTRRRAINVTLLAHRAYSELVGAVI